MWREIPCEVSLSYLDAKVIARFVDASRLCEQIGGPMWGAPIHNREFVKEMLEHVEENSKDFKTSERIKGMLTVAYNVRSLSSYLSESQERSD